jgi:transposase
VGNSDSGHAPMFVPVVADSPKPGSNDVAIEVELGGAVIRIGRTASPDLATAVIQAFQVQR